MRNIFLTITILTGLNIVPTCTGHLPYFNNRVSPTRVDPNQNYWFHHQKESYSKWHKISSKPTVSQFPWHKKFVLSQANAITPSSAVVQTPSIQQSSLESLPLTTETNNKHSDKQKDLSDLEALIHQLEQKLQQVEQKLSGSDTLKQNEPQESLIKENNSKTDPKLTEDSVNDPFWVKLDVVNKEIDHERLIKTIKSLLENLKESTRKPDTPADRSEENVHDLIDIRSNFNSR